MSLINQMLSDLEKRGAAGVSSESVIRPVSVQNNKRKLILWAAAALTLSIILASVLWWAGAQHHPAASENMAKFETVHAPDQTDEAPQAADQAASRQDTIIMQKADAPALLLSSELSSLPLPAGLRNTAHSKEASPEDEPRRDRLADAATAAAQSPPAKPLPGQQQESSQAADHPHPIETNKVSHRAPAVNSAPTATPIIAGVSPNPVVATGIPKPFIINGSNFSKGSKVTLRFSHDKKYANRRISSQNATQIIINPNFGDAHGDWTVEVINPGGVSSGQFAFTVQTPPDEASGQGRKNTASAPVALPAGSVNKQIKPLSVQQQADNEFHKANILMQQGRNVEAIAGYESALQLDAGHDAARQAMVGLLLESKRNADAEGVLQAGLNHDPKHTAFAMLLARLQVERGALPQALETLQKTLPYAAQQADYQAFIAAVEQRMGQNKEAVAHYQAALQSSPNSGIWLMGLGISLKALQQKDEARVAFKHALESHSLNQDLQAFVTQQLKEL